MDMEKDASKKSVNPNESNLLLDSDIGEILPLPMTEKIKVKPPVKFQFHSYKAKNKKKH